MGDAEAGLYWPSGTTATDVDGMADATLMRHWAARRRMCGAGALSMFMMHGMALAAHSTHTT